MDLSMVPYATPAVDDPTHNDDAFETKALADAAIRSRRPSPDPAPPARYRECMRNHAASLGRHASDGCGEFMPPFGAGGAASSNPLSCAACGCHRNFHRREPSLPNPNQLLLSPPPPPSLLLYGPGPATPSKLRGFASYAASANPFQGLNGSGREDDRRSETPEREEPPASERRSAAGSKRFRTKFTAEQKERMLEFAERSGWRIQRPDDAALAQFCAEIGIKRKVLKVWMHNNKNAHRRRRGEQLPSPSTVPPPPPPGFDPADGGVSSLYCSTA